MKRKPRKGGEDFRRKVAKRKNVSLFTVKKLDTIFSQYIRKAYADNEGLVKCYTCPHRAHWKKLHAGHYLTRYFKATRWDENNVRPQCFMCNIYRKGNSVIFRQNLVAEIGEPKVIALEENANYSIRGATSPETLKPLFEYYQKKLEELGTSV